LLSEQPRLSPKSVVVFNGLPPVEKPSEAKIQSFRSSVGALNGDVVVTLAGRINKWKGQELLLAAAIALKRRGVSSELRIVIVGGPAPGLEGLPETLRKQAEAGGIGEICTFCEFVDDIWPVWFGSDIAVVPSTEPEPFGMVAIEAMAAGLPVIAAEHGGLLDIVVDGETGLLFRPKDIEALANALEQLLVNAPLRKSLGVSGRTRQAMLFSMESQIALTEKTYLEMTS
jgi:glycosyltransferase involved in cell wall biosynthesis